MAKSDGELVALAQAGNLEAFDELVRLHQQHVYALAYRMLMSADDAQDVQQETFVKAWRSMGKFRGDAAFSTWLHRITVNLCISRKRRREPLQMETFTEERLSTGIGDTATACLEKKEAAAAVRRVLAAMPAHYRALVVLRDLEERPFEEVARILGCSEASARTRACRARKMLREKLRPFLAEGME